MRPPTSQGQAIAHHHNEPLSFRTMISPTSSFVDELTARATAISGNVIPRDSLPTEMPISHANAPVHADSIIVVPGVEALPEPQRITIFKKGEYGLLTSLNSTRPRS